MNIIFLQFQAKQFHQTHYTSLYPSLNQLYLTLEAYTKQKILSAYHWLIRETYQVLVVPLHWL